MSLSKDLREPIKGMGPISEEEAEQLLAAAEQAVGPSPIARPGEPQDALNALHGLQVLNEYHASAVARQFVNATDGFFHERDVVIPAEEAFAAANGLTRDDLEAAWSERRAGIKGQIRRSETERLAALRDQFFATIDAIGAEQMGDNYTYDSFIGAQTSPDDLLTQITARLAPPDTNT